VQVSGDSHVVAVNGIATFGGMQLRAGEGAYRIQFSGLLLNPNRQLSQAQVRVFIPGGAACIRGV
jgi:hypothetical protein